MAKIYLRKIETIIYPNILYECYAVAAASIDLITLSTFAMDSFTMEFEFSVGDRTIKFDPKFKDPSIETDTEVKCLQVEQCVAVVEEVEASLLIPLRLEVSEICSVEIPVTDEDKRRICSETSQCCGRKPSNGQRCENRRRGIHPVWCHHHCGQAAIYAAKTNSIGTEFPSWWYE